MCEIADFNEQDIRALAERVRAYMSEKRFSHTLGVVRCAMALGELILPESVGELCAAALLHDVAKEIPRDELISLLSADPTITEEDKNSDGVLHSFAAPFVISRDFPEFASENILSATGKHTVGSAGMSVFDMIVFVSDYAEDTRTYESCIKVRRALFDELDSLGANDRLHRLIDACLMAIDGTIETLTRTGRVINSRVYETKNALLMKKMKI